ncbi:sporulation repeat-containing protein [Caballeronia arationis]|jgi:DedD protein|uniref:Cell division protein DedD (Protein involved in septation) n=1 Tax=Caballeronia arationis TaxID=1777142 RepID=A0A7Z7I501_9BURK|nr:SPOR domain-containing protein [Caballeronia arationis]SAL00990.1 sporulation repeat-containing protein [Caballeronia arationis]SOE63278.1 Cell division protein DedD (protein involved in septation) [Caballeronia arationis]
MGLFSFGKKDDAPDGRDAYSDSSRGTRHTVRTERRTRRTERPDADAMMLDPTLPEKQRARRRLVGAVALVLAAVIVLPMVLDSRPKPVTDDIAIDIPNRPAPAAKPASKEPTDADTQAGVAPDGPAAASDNVAAGVTAPESKPASGTATAAQAKPEPKPAETKPQAKAEAKPKAATPPAAVASPSPSPKAPAEADEGTAAANPAASPANTPSSPAGSRFVVQIGTFDDEAAAQSWVTKLKAAGVPAYVEHRKQADGSTRALLRAGPFADRAAASAALVKVRQAGLGGGTGK